MKFHLQLFPPTFSGWMVVLLVLILPAALTAYVLHSLVLLVIVPFGIIVLAFFTAALPGKRKVTPEQFADELEKHLLGTEGAVAIRTDHEDRCVVSRKVLDENRLNKSFVLHRWSIRFYI
jgi:hypothetical protein